MGEIVLDLSNVPLKPVGKKEISQLEMALIIGTLYRPEVLELIKDPVERATWIDSLAVAAAAFARHKSGLTTTQIAEELGRSEMTIRGHLNQKTKAGKLIAETFEKLKKGELKLVIPFIKAPTALDEELRSLRGLVERLKEENRKLEEELKVLREESEKIKQTLRDKEANLDRLRSELENAIREKNEVIKKYISILEELKKIKQLIVESLSLLDKLFGS